MNRTLYARIIVLAVVAGAFPIAVLADLSGNTILQANAALNLDTGAVVSSGGDILWNGSTITPQGSAKARSLPNLGATNFDGLSESYWDTVARGGQSTPIAALAPGDVLAVTTNSGKIAKVLVTANSGGLITLRFTTFGASAPPGVPTITQILNNSSGTPPGMPNYGIAPSSLFIIQGSGMADSGTPVLQDTQAAGGLPLTLNGASITVTVGATTTHPALYYTSSTQLAAVLPAATPPGAGTLTVTYRGTNSTPAPIQVVASAVGINHFNQIPIPPPFFNENVDIGVATDAFTGAVLTSTSSGAPGQTIVIWATGMGADPADSDNTYIAAPHAINTPMQVYLGGVLVPLLYQGASVYPGVDVIIFTIPDSVPSGCYVPLAAVTGNVISNVVVFPIHPGGGSCVEPALGVTGDQILHGTQDALKTGVVTLVQTNSTNSKGVLTVTNSANAAFQHESGLLAAATGRGALVSPGGCAVGPIVAGGQLTFVGLDAGTVTLTGPAGLAVRLDPQLGIKGIFGAILAAGAIPSSGGAFTFTGSGGADVGSFTSTVTLSNPIFKWTNQSAAASVDRTQGLTVTWTGGNPGTSVVISGTSTGSGVTVGYGCRVAAEAGQFTVPSYILMGLPAGTGGVNLQNDVFSTLSATGLDTTSAVGTISFSTPATFR